MTTSDLRRVNLGALIRMAVKASVQEAMAKTRTPSTLSGTVEQLDEDLDVIWVRMDFETMSGDPTESSNYEMPGVIPATRLGETFTDEQVRVVFDGPAGASAQRTSTENRIVLPFGAESGRRIVADGEGGFIAFYDENDNIVGYLDSNQWFVGGEVGLQARLDPIGGLRLRDENDQARVTLSAPEGLILRNPTAGISGALLRHDGLIILDPDTGDRISITSGTTSAVPSPHWASTPDEDPDTTHDTPAISSFGTGDDIDLRFISASAAADLGVQSWTPPTGFTEQTDQNNSGSITLATSLATKDPAAAAPALATFTSTTAAFTRGNGHTVIVQGGGGTSPAIGSVNVNTVIEFTSQQLAFNINAPVLVVEGDLMIAHVALAAEQIPIGWTVPEGWIQLGIQVAGLGTTHIHGSGIWYKRAGPSEPASEPITINMTAAGKTKLQATVARVTNPFGYPAGLDVRRNNRSMPRGLVAQDVSSIGEGPYSVTSVIAQLSLTDVEFLAGRTYAISYHEPHIIFSGSGRWDILLRKDGATMASFGSQQDSFGGTVRVPMDSTIYYVPTANEIVDLTIAPTESLDGATIEFVGASTQQRALTVLDLGAKF